MVSTAGLPQRTRGTQGTMLQKLLQFMHLSCRHDHLSRPVASAASGQSAAADWDSVVSNSGTGHYVVCLDCGRKFAYDWSNMRVVW